MKREFKVTISDREREPEVLSLLAHIMKHLGAEVQEITSKDEEIMEAKSHLSPKEILAFDEILPIFYNNVGNTCNFLQSIRGRKPTHITLEVNSLLQEKQISKDYCKTRLWRALNSNGLYPCGQVNWCKMIIIPKTLTKLNADWKI